MSTSLNAIKDTIMLHINEAEMRIRMNEIVLNVLQKFKGKKLTKRLETAIKEQLGPNAIVSYTVDGYGIFKHGELKIWAVNGYEYSNRFTSRLGSNEELDAYNPEGYNDANNVASSKAYVEKLWSLLNDDTDLRAMCTAVDDCKTAWDRLDKIDHNSALDTVRYDLQRLTGLQVSRY
jgi:hypothetical protein